MSNGSGDEGVDDYVENMSSYSDDDYGYEEEGGDNYAEVIDVDVETENFAVLTMEELEKRQKDDVFSISSVLSVSREVAILVLIHFNWDVNKAEEEWFRDGERIRQSIGLLMNPTTKLYSFDDIVLCRICLEDFGVDQMTAAVCGHLFCYTCWISYISISINDGPGCLFLRCPDPKCSVAIGEDMVKMVTKEDGDKYRKYLIRSYVENNKKLKWCPSPNCEYAIKFELGSESFDVKCGCSCSFCWNCLEEIHRPVDCVTVANWNCKNKNESENTNWILANSKPCPKCKKPIEKNLGCMHMTCSCRHEFCWLCLQTWSEHTSDFYRCNKFEKEKQAGGFTEEERKRLTAKNSLDKYIHFYERWAANEDSRKKSLVQLEHLEGEQLQKISDAQQVDNITDIEYITKAWQQIIECRRLLKWAYAYGYYIADEERAKKEFFEFIQGEAEGALERLHQCAEKEVLQYAYEGPSPDFKNLKEKLCRLTRVTKDYFEHLARALENDLVDVTSKDECKTGLADFELLAYQDWVCSRCTIYNSFDKRNCDVCFHPRPDT